MKLPSLILFLFFTFPAFGQASFKKELSENKFFSIHKKQIPMEVLQVLGYDSYSEIGTRASQKGCTSRKNAVINWAVTDKNGLYVLSVSSCGAYSNTKYYIISKNVKTEVDLSHDFRTFKNFRQAYISTSAN